MKLYRASGEPIKKQDQEAYKEELNKEYDKIEEELGKCNSTNVKEFEKKLNKVVKNLLKKYPNEMTISMPKTTKAMAEFTKPYGAVAFCVENDKLVAYIMDS